MDFFAPPSTPTPEQLNSQQEAMNAINELAQALAVTPADECVLEALFKRVSHYVANHLPINMWPNNMWTGILYHLVSHAVRDVPEVLRNAILARVPTSSDTIPTPLRYLVGFSTRLLAWQQLLLSDDVAITPLTDDITIAGLVKDMQSAPGCWFIVRNHFIQLGRSTGRHHGHQFGRPAGLDGPALDARQALNLIHIIDTEVRD